MGLATAKLLYSRGAHISIADIRQGALDEAMVTIKQTSSDGTMRVFAQVVDVREPSQVDAWLDATIQEFGRLDGAANIAGVVGPNALLVSTAEMSNEEWEFVMGVNSTGTFNCVRKELQVLVQGGAIVNIASVWGVRGCRKHVAYTASKHAVIGITRSAALDGLERNIRVNVVAP
jgi:NAD(P)-dependent dehydrogenase (short-subunit alcohol dehydrogenase family)